MTALLHRFECGGWRWFSASAVVLSLGIMAGGCSGREELTLEEYFERLDATLQEGNARSAELEFTREDSAATFEEKKEAASDELNARLAIIADAVDELEGLEPPTEIRDAHDEFLSLFKEYQQAGEEAVEKFDDAQSEGDLEAARAEMITDLQASAGGFNRACNVLDETAARNNIAVGLGCDDVR